MNKTTLSVQELASQLGIGLSKAYALVKEPDFPTAILLGGFEDLACLTVLNLEAMLRRKEAVQHKLSRRFQTVS